jgi:apolipoprotein N-acyltransferase
MPREDIWPLIFVSVAMILVAIRGLRFWPATALGFFAGLAFYMSQVEWLSLYLGPVPWIALSVMEALIFAAGSGAIAIVWTWAESFKKSFYRNTLIALAIAAMWTAREWVATNFPYGGFPWSRVAQALSESFLAQLVYFVGISGLTFVSVFITVAILQAMEVEKIALKANALSLAASALAVATAGLFVVPTVAEAGTLTIAAVQGNANAGLFANAEKGTFLKNHLEATSLLDSHPDKGQIDFMVWPENASDLNPQANPLALAQVGSVVSTYGVPLILGAITESDGSFFNSSLYYDAQGLQIDQYDKKRPVPFAEYVPDRQFWNQLAPDLIGLVSRDYAFGARDGIFALGASQLGVLICFEIAIDDIGRDLVAGGAQIILSQTNNADFGRSDETFQQAALARLRAIETGRTVVNISTVGVSRIFLPNGEIISELPIFEPGVMVEEVPLRTSITPAMAISPYFDLTVNFMALALLVPAIRRIVKRERRSA